MPAARPSQASIRNVLAALKAAGQLIAAVDVAVDGSFRVEVGAAGIAVAKEVRNPDAPMRWEDLK
jgi:hypothetical protein